MRKTFVLDTDIWTLYFRDNEKVKKRVEQTNDGIAITVITRVEVLRGRFDFLFKAATGDELHQAMERLKQSERDLTKFNEILVDAAAEAKFDNLRQMKKLKKI